MLPTSADKFCHMRFATGKFFVYLCHAFLPSQCGELHFHRITSQAPVFFVLQIHVFNYIFPHFTF